MCKLKVGFLVIFISLFLTTGKSSQNVTQVKYCNIKICLNISIKKYCTNGKRRNKICQNMYSPLPKCTPITGKLL